MDLWRVACQAYQEHLEQLSQGLVVCQDLSNALEGVLGRRPDLLVRIADRRDQLDYERAEQLDRLGELALVLRTAPLDLRDRRDEAVDESDALLVRLPSHDRRNRLLDLGQVAEAVEFEALDDPREDLVRLLLRRAVGGKDLHVLHQRDVVLALQPDLLEDRD